MKALFADPTYAPLLGFAAVEFQPMHCKADRARQRFTVTTPTGQRASYVAHLIRTAGGPERGCWLTEAILRIAGS